MKHVACGGWIEIRTDPKNTAYVVTEGARKRDLGDDKVAEGDIKILTQEEREALRDNAFASLEGKNDDKQRLAHSKKRLEQLRDLSEQLWDDPYEKNRQLRKTFREGRKLREKETSATEALQEKMSLGIELLPEHENDAQRAKVIDFGDFDHQKAMAKTVSKPLFTNVKPSTRAKPATSKVSRKQKVEDLAKQRTADAIAEIRGNTRASMDPFLANTPKGSSRSLLGVKRKRSAQNGVKTEVFTSSLVDYDSN